MMRARDGWMAKAMSAMDKVIYQAPAKLTIRYVIHGHQMLTTGNRLVFKPMTIRIMGVQFTFQKMIALEALRLCHPPTRPGLRNTRLRGVIGGEYRCPMGTVRKSTTPHFSPT